MSAYKKLTPYASIKMFSYKNIDTNDVYNVYRLMNKTCCNNYKSFAQNSMLV